MLKRRLIFTLLFDNGNFMLSRNFRLQKVGSLDWIKKHYEFQSIAGAIDELVVLNVSREERGLRCFSDMLSELARDCFMPIAAGGNIGCEADAFQLFAAGADKVVVNTALARKPELVKSLTKVFGSQSIIASLDYKRVGDRQCVFVDKGSENTGLSVVQGVEQALRLNVGEIYLTSIDRDGTGQGYDLDTLAQIAELAPVPVIASGGVGRFDQLLAGIVSAGVPAVSTANLFNFMADGLSEARAFLRESGIDLASWQLGGEAAPDFRLQAVASH